MKKIVIQIIGIVLFLLAIIFLNLCLYQLSDTSGADISRFKLFLLSNYPLFLAFMSFICAAIGALFGLFFYLLPQWGQKGRWRFEWHKLLIWGIPILIVIASGPLYWVFGWLSYTPFYQWSKFIDSIYVMLSVVFGVIVMGSFRKTPDKNKE